MLLSELGEWGLIDKISKQFRKTLPPGTFGIGDDAAVIPWTDTSSLLVTTDLLLEGTHFLREEVSPLDLGYKSLAVNLSDLAAMGGKPICAFLSLGLPRDLTEQWMDEFLLGFQKLADSFSVSLLGGDTTESKNGIVINVTAMGKIETSNLKLRSQAKPGDLVCVTGQLGNSAAGLKALLEKMPKDFFVAHLIQQHHRPKPYVTEGQWLAEQGAVHAMMDVSDGLNITLKEVARKSNCGFDIHLNELPISNELRKVADQFGWDPYEIAAAGGEDYTLLFTVSEDEYPKIASEYSLRFNQTISKIGTVIDRPETILLQLNGKPYPKHIQSWNHFKE